MGPDELIRVAYVAQRHYRDGHSRIEIAAELGLSRFKVARMLDKARDLGIVRIEIAAPDTIDPELSIGLQNRFGLTHAVAVTTAGEAPKTIQQALGKAAAGLLREIVTEEDLLGFTAGRTLGAAVNHLEELPSCDVVALGGVAGPVREHGVEIIRRVARASGGESYPIFAPMLVQDEQTAHALRNDRIIVDAYAKFDAISKGVVAIGSWDPADSQLYDAAAEQGVADDLVAAGVVGEVCATLFDRDGRIIDAIDHRSISITADQLRAVPEVIAVAGGPTKTDAVRAALRTGLIDSLVTDAALAERLLATP